MTVHALVFIVSTGFYKLAIWRLRMEPNVANSNSFHCILFLGLWNFWTLLISYVYTDRQTEIYAHVHTHTHNFQHNHCLYSRQMPQWETTTPKFLVNKTVSSAWSHSHKKSLLVRPKKNWIPRYQVRAWCMFQHFPPTMLQPQCGHLALWGVAQPWRWKYQGRAIPGFLLQRASLSLSIVLQQYW